MALNLDLGFPDKDPSENEEPDDARVDDAAAPLEVDMGAALEFDQDAVAEAENTSSDLEGFETGAAFLDLEDTSVDATDSAVPYAPLRQEPPRPAPTDAPRTESRPPKPSAIRIARKPPARRPRLTRLQLSGGVLALLVGVGGGVALYTGVVEVRVVIPSDRAGTVDPPAAPLAPQPETPVMSHVLFVDTWREAETPAAMVAALRERMPDLLSFVSAVSVDEDVGYALMVGPAYSAVEAEGLREPIAAAFELLNPDPASWVVQAASYAFLLGEYEAPEDANARLRELADLAVPTYVLQVAYADGTNRLRVYGGAFADEEQAESMALLLREVGLDEAPFTERRGQLPSWGDPNHPDTIRGTP